MSLNYLNSTYGTGNAGASVATETARATAAEALLVPKTTTVNGRALTGNISVVAADVGLGNVNNTADTDKPVSVAQAAADAATLTAAVTAAIVAITSGNHQYSGAQSFTQVNVGILNTVNVTILDVGSGNQQKFTVAANTGFDFMNWAASGKYSDCLIEIVNGGAFTLTFPTVNWELPNQAGYISSISAYLTAIGRSPATLKTTGSDFVYFWTTDGGVTVYAKLI